MIRVLLVDDHPFYREGIRAMLSDESLGVRIMAEASCGEDAVDLVAAQNPDVVVMDLAMPGIGGLEAIRRLRAADPDLPVLVLTMHDDESVFAALRAGARGYLLKDAGIDELVRAVTAVHRGEAIFGPAVARRLTAHFATAPGIPASDAFPELTDRERDVLALLADDLGTAAIARRLGLSEKTVYNYVATVLAKLRARDRAEAGQRARAAGLGEVR
ncbi:response regulator [Microbacterium sp. No. 7]|uniref:response regulator n=1 Tax=Microbacterium sp. No. 7 TaxID=1714373 RepID=UPI0006CFCA57|nr:response regulator transcription factor [Microbacterium sp. No. 7]ALJ20432.1 LuxR family transcriptional regulator [Microbacterium sp. No. 7]